MSLLLIYAAKKIPAKGTPHFFLGVINMVIINAQKILQVSILSAPTPLIPGSCDRGPAHYWSTSFLPLPATLKSLVLCQRFGAVAENWAPCGGEPFFFSKGGEHELQKHAASFWRKVAGVDDSDWNLCRRIENYRRYSPYLDILISWKHLLTIQDGTPVFEEERWRALAITKRCIIVLAQPSDTFNPGAEAAILGYKNNIFYLQLWYCNCLQLDCQSNSATNTSLPKRFRPVRLVELVGSIWPGRHSSSSTLGSEVKNTVWNEALKERRRNTWSLPKKTFVCLMPNSGPTSSAVAKIGWSSLPSPLNH